MLKRFLLLCVSSSIILIAVAACSGGVGLTPTPTTGASPTSTPSVTSSPVPSPTESPTATQPTPTLPPTSSPGTFTGVTNAFYQAVEAQNYHLAYTYLDANATTTNGKKLTLNTFTQLAQAGDSTYGPVVSFSIGAYPPLAVMTVSRKILGPYHSHLTLKHEGNTWKIITIDTI
ncbi:MAG TPA: hypothetical protein VF043_23780 [Ktedonobacteraceae bacterium]